MASVSLSPATRAIDLTWRNDGSLDGTVDLELSQIKSGRWVAVSQTFVLEEDPGLTLAREGRMQIGPVELILNGGMIAILRSGRPFGTVSWNDFEDGLRRSFREFDRQRRQVAQHEKHGLTALAQKTHSVQFANE